MTWEGEQWRKEIIGHNRASVKSLIWSMVHTIEHERQDKKTDGDHETKSRLDVQWHG